MSKTNNPGQLTQLDARMHTVWQRTQMLHLIAGMLAFFRWAIPLFLLAVVIDWMTYMPTLGRGVGLMLLLIVSFYKAWQQGWKHLRRFNATYTALLLEKHHGGLESLLVSAVQLRETKSDVLRDQTCRLAETAAVAIQAKQAVPSRRLLRPAAVLFVLGLIIGGFAIAEGPFLRVGLTRIFMPWIEIAYPTKTKLKLEKGELIVKEGEGAEIVIGVSGVVPETATLLLRTGEGTPRDLTLEITAGECVYTLAAASRDFSYRVKAGDARSDWRSVRVITAPRIEQAEVILEFPTYLQRPAETVNALTLTVPEDTAVQWHLTVDRPIREAVLHRDGEDPLPLIVSEDGRQLTLNEKVDASRGYSFAWTEKQHGFDFESPRYYLQVASDQPPQVELSSPDANLNALLGRQLDLAVRARDDHGIGETTITYRVNLRPAKTVALDNSVLGGMGEEALDWDYRETLPDLKIGDSVTFIVEVADRYPGTDGPHRARSETRRITFLSREEYLAQIERKKDRILSQVRSTYRQERAAHELVRNLNARANSFLQTCQLEAIRQEMLRQQIKDTAAELQLLLDDLTANNVTDAVEGETLIRVRTSLQTIAETRVAKAASLLRDQTNAAATGKADPTAAIHVVNQSARDLAEIVLQRGIDYAREVFARESHMLAREQATLRLLVTQSQYNDATTDATQTQMLADRQQELANWTNELILALQNGMRYDKRPISVLGLTRRIKELRNSGAEAKMLQAADLIRAGEKTEATTLHTEILAPLLAAEFSMRTGSEYAAIRSFGEQLDLILKDQQALRSSCANLNAGEFKTQTADLFDRQSDLQASLAQALLPVVPTPRPRLFDQKFREPPPVKERRVAAEAAVASALEGLINGQQRQTLEAQRNAEQQLADLAKLLKESALEISLRTEGLNLLVSIATERVTQIEDYEARQIVLLEQTEESALDELKSEPLVEPQTFLAEEVAEFATELRSKYQADKDVLPLLSRLDQLTVVHESAVKMLAENRAEDALEHQEVAADLLADALAIAQAQSARLALLQGLQSFQRSVGTANQWMIDIVAEQNDLVIATKAATPETGTAIIPAMNNLRQCLTDIAPVLDLVAGRLDAGTPLVFAETDLEDAAFAIEDEDYLDAADAQEVAAESLAEVQGLVAAVQQQTGYVAEIVEFLHTAHSEVALLAFQQEQFKRQVMLTIQRSTADGQLAPELLSVQDTLQAETEKSGRQLELVTGIATHATAGQQMREAYLFLKSEEPDEAIAQMELAEAALNETAEELFLVITMLHGLPSIEVFSYSPEELVLLLEVLSFASDQRAISRQTEVAEMTELAALAVKQATIEKASTKALRLDPPHPLLVKAQQQIAAATTAMQSSDRDQARRSQDAADQSLRQFIIDQALVLETAMGASASSDDPVLTEAETDDLSVSVANFVSDFVSGEAPKDQRTEWEVLGNRNRAALNQNFARELPLEYRGTLKDYYERVAK
ncbi:MAG: hypothetical protein P8L85_11010 [Rubripirellula sp.]|nr:hypothetical protein [Rubripirellula sp.]